MKIAPLLTVVLLAPLVTSCATRNASGREASGRPTVYAGTKLNVSALQNDQAELDIYQMRGVAAPYRPLLDMPVSLAADTLLLPIDAYYWATDGIPTFGHRPSWSGLIFEALKESANSNSTSQAD